MAILRCGAEMKALMEVSNEDVATIEETLAERIAMGVPRRDAERQAVAEAIAMLAEERALVMEAVEKKTGVAAELRQGKIAPADVADVLGEKPAGKDVGDTGTPMFSRTEGAKDLLIQHNLTAENLLHADRMGGLAVPSLAITKADAPLQNFGEITLLGDRNMADPKQGIKAYGADIYSPRYPQISYDLDISALAKLNAALAPHRKEGERQIYGGEITRVDDLISDKAFKAYADSDGTANWSDLKAKAASLLWDAGAGERLFQGFTGSGNRRYKAHTLENVIAILKKELRGGEGFNYGAGSLRAKFTQQFRSIAAIKKTKGTLVSKEQFEAVKDEVNNELVSIAEDLNKPTDTVIAIFEDAPRMGLKRAADQYDIELGDEMSKRMGEFMTRLRNMPTEYFEGKFLRGVGIGEFKAAVVPEGSDPAVLALLKREGVAVFTYKKGNQADRARVVKDAASITPDVLFSRTEALTPTESIKRVVRVKTIVDGIAAGWKNAPRIVVVENMDDTRIPQQVRDKDAEMKADGATGEPRGFITGGVVYIVAGQNKSVEDVITTLAHESLGHGGLRGLFGPLLDGILDQIVAVKRGDVINKAIEYGLHDAKKGASKAEVFASMTLEQKRQAAEEVLAILAQTKPQAGFVKRAIAAIRKWLSDNGIKLELTDNDILVRFILPARAFIERGAKPAWVEPAQKALAKRKLAEERAAAFARGDTWAGYPTQEAYEAKLAADVAQGERIAKAYHDSGSLTDQYGIQLDRNARREAGTADRDEISPVDITPKRDSQADTFAGYATQAEWESARKDISFSRPGKGQQSAHAPRQLLEFGVLNYWLSRNMIVDMVDDILPEAALLKHAHEIIDADTNSMMAESDKLLSRLRRMDNDVRDEFATIGHESTIEDVDPSRPYSMPSKIRMLADKARESGGKTLIEKTRAVIRQSKERHAELAAQYGALPQNAQDLFVGLRDSYNEMSSTVFAETTARIERQPIDPKTKAKLVRQLSEEHDKMKSGFYWPLFRSGEYVVIGMHPETKRRVVEHHEKESNAIRVANEMRADGYSGVRSTKRKELEGDFATNAAMTDILKAINEFDPNQQTKDSLTDAVNQAIIRMMPDQSYRRHYIHRKNTPGYSSDFIRAFSSSAWHSANAIANLRHGDKVTGAFKAMQKAVDKLPGQQQGRAQDSMNALARREKTIHEPVSALAQGLQQFAFLGALASLGTATINLLQTPTLSFPWMGARYGALNATVEVTRAMKDQIAAIQKPESVSALTKITPGDMPAALDMRKRLKGKELAAMEILNKTNKIELSQAYDLIRAANESTVDASHPGMMALDAVARYGALPQAVTEVMNRQVTAIAVIRLELAKSGDVQKAAEMGAKVLDETHYDYSRSNRPQVLSGTAGRIIGTFKQYAFNTAYLWVRTAYQTTAGADAETRRIARKQLALMVATQATVSGILGLPILGSQAVIAAGGVAGFKVGGDRGAIAGIALATGVLIFAGMGDDDEDFDVQIRREMARLASKLDGMVGASAADKIGEVMMDGAFRLTGVDIAGRTGAAELLLRTPDDLAKGRAQTQRWMEAYLGYYAGVVHKTITGANLMANGEIVRGVEKIMPIKQFADIMAAYRYADEGVKSGKKLIDEPGAAGVAVKAYGFQPASTARAQKALRAEMEGKRLKSVYRKQYGAAMEEKDRTEMRRIRSEVADLQRNYPTIKVNLDTVKAQD